MSNNMSKTRSIILADDHAVVRSGLKLIISEIKNADVISETEDGLTAISLIKQHNPDLAILDAAMPLAKGIEVYADARRWSPKTFIILFTGFTASGILRDWLEAGVDGIVLKSCAPQIVSDAICSVLAGGKFIAPSVQNILSESGNYEKLSAREREVLSLIASGHKNQSIANRLSISIRTVEKHRKSLMQKLGAETTGELMSRAIREGLLEDIRQL